MEEIIKFYETIKDIKYGWYDKNKNLHESLKDGNFKKDYRMQKSKAIMKSKHAICWEMCELEREFFKKKKIEYKVIFAFLKNDKRYPCHTFVVFKYDKKWYWLESSWEKEKGIHEYNFIYEILEYIRSNFRDFSKRAYKKEDIIFYEYKKPILFRRCNSFYYHCLHSKKI